MPTLVHLADEREAAGIKRNGIKVGKHRSGVFCMPVLQNFYVSHQWLRELKRRGVKTFVGVYFKVDSKTKVFAGRYNSPHRYIELGEAIKEINSIEDPLGYEIIIDRKIEAKEISKIKSLPQNIGWRYKPGSKGTRPCSCEYCIRASIKANRVREKYGREEVPLTYRQILELLKSEKDIYKIENLLARVRGKKRRSDPAELLFLLDKNSPSVEQDFALTLAVFNHKNTWETIQQLLGRPDDDTREYAADSLLKLYGEKAENYLKQLNDPAIQRSLDNWVK
jgi:hypothetical protein